MINFWINVSRSVSFWAALFGINTAVMYIGVICGDWFLAAWGGVWAVFTFLVALSHV